MDFNVQVFKAHVIAEVPVKPIGLFHDQSSAPWILAEKLGHLLELPASGRLGGFHIDEFAKDFQVMLGRILSEKLKLGRNRVAFSFLIFAGHSRVKNSSFHICPRFSQSIAALNLEISPGRHAQGVSPGLGEQPNRLCASQDTEFLV
jgi:hypothetical protein